MDTTNDPDRATAHGDLPATDPVALLHGALASSAADHSATQARKEQAQADSSPSRVIAEGAALRALARERRLITALLAAGYTANNIDDAKDADRWRPLLEAVVAAERIGIETWWVSAVVGSPRTQSPLEALEAEISAARTAPPASGSEHPDSR